MSGLGMHLFLFVKMWTIKVLTATMLAQKKDQCFIPMCATYNRERERAFYCVIANQVAC